MSWPGVARPNIKFPGLGRGPGCRGAAAGGGTEEVLRRFSERHRRPEDLPRDHVPAGRGRGGGWETGSPFGSWPMWAVQAVLGAWNFGCPGPAGNVRAGKKPGRT